ARRCASWVSSAVTDCRAATCCCNWALSCWALSAADSSSWTFVWRASHTKSSRTASPATPALARTIWRRCVRTAATSCGSTLIRRWPLSGGRAASAPQHAHELGDPTLMDDHIRDRRPDADDRLRGRLEVLHQARLAQRPHQSEGDEVDHRRREAAALERSQQRTNHVPLGGHQQ